MCSAPDSRNSVATSLLVARPPRRMETTSPRASSGCGSEPTVPPSPRKSRSSTLAAILSCASASAHSDATDGSEEEQSTPTLPHDAQSPRRTLPEGGSDAVLPRGGSPQADAAAAATTTTRAADSLRGMLVVALPSRKLMSLFLRREFGVDAAVEPLLYDASCALREGALLSQGRLFVFSSRMFFYSNVFGITRRLALPMSNVHGFAKRRLAAKGAFGALEVTCVDGKAVTLVSFWDRSKALRVLQSTWQAWKDEPRNAVTASSGDAAAEESPRSSSSSGSTEGPPSRSARSMPAVLWSTPPPLDGLTQLQLTDDDPTMQLPCTLGGIYTLCLSDGSNFLQAFRAARGELDVEVPMWSDEEAAHVRCVTWRSPLESHRQSGLRLPGIIPAFTRIQEQQRCMAFSHESGEVRLVLQFTSSQLDIPWGKFFAIESRLELCAPAEDAHATASGYARVRWLRQPSLSFIRHEVERRSLEQTAASMRQMMQMAASYLRSVAVVPDDAAGEEAQPEAGEAEAASEGAFGEGRPREDSSEAIRFAPVAFSAVCDALRTTEDKCRRAGEMPLWVLARWVALLVLCFAVFMCGRRSAGADGSSS